MFASDDPFVGIDLDGCRDPATGAVEAWARPTIERFATYCEVSPSGTGVHLIVEGALPAWRPQARARPARYDSGRYFTITARSLNGVPVGEIEARWDELEAWHAEHFPPSDPGATRSPSLRPRSRRRQVPLPRTMSSSSGRARRRDSGRSSGRSSTRGGHERLRVPLRGRPRALHVARLLDRPGRRVHGPALSPLSFPPQVGPERGPGPDYGQRTVRIAIERSASDRPRIVFTGLGGDVPLHQILPPAIATLARRCAESVYARGEVLSRVIQAQEPGKDGIQRGSAPRIVRLPDSILRERLDEAARWAREKRNRQGEIVQREEWCPRAVVEAIRDRATWPGIRPLLGVVTAPTLRPDGSVLDRPGYDTATGLIYAPAREYPDIPEHPDERQVGEAFRDLSSRSGSSPSPPQPTRPRSRRSCSRLPAASPSRGQFPFTAVIAPEFGSGKTLLAHAATRAMTGHGTNEMAPVGGR